MVIRQIEVAGHILNIHERNDTNDPATGRALTGSWLWDAAIVLADWMASQGCVQLPAATYGLTFLELGAGTGLPGLAAAAVLGARRVLLTDVAPLIPGLRANVEVNGLAGRVSVHELRWGEVGPSLGEVDVVLMSDVFYDVDEMEALARTLRRVWGASTRGWAATEVRAGVDGCLEVLRREGFEAAELEMSRRQMLRSPEESSDFALYLISRAAAMAEI